MAAIATDTFTSHTSLANILAPLTTVFVIDDGVTSIRSDTAELDYVTRAVYLGTSGTVKVTTANGQDVVLTNLAAGVWHPLRIRRVFLTGTDDSLNILGGY